MSAFRAFPSRRPVWPTLQTPASLICVVAFVLPVSVHAAADHYGVLGVDRGATAQQIKQAFRKLSLKWHPDMHQKDKEKAQDKFIRIGAAHEVLQNATKRASYDVYGQEGVDNDWFVDPDAVKSGTTFNSGAAPSPGVGFGGQGFGGTGHGHAGFGSGFGGASGLGATGHGHAGFGSSFGDTSGKTFGTGYASPGASYVHTGYDSAGNPTYTSVPSYDAYSNHHTQYGQYGHGQYAQYAQYSASGQEFNTGTYSSAQSNTQSFGGAGAGAGGHTGYPDYANVAHDYANYYANHYASFYANHYGPAPPPPPPPPPASIRNLFGLGLPGIEELTDVTWAEMLEENAFRRSVVVLFYRRDVVGANSLKDIFVEFGEKFAVPGIVELGVVNCGQLVHRCALELGASTGLLPVIRYYGPNSAEPVTYSKSSVGFTALSAWTIDVMANYCQVLRSMSDVYAWLTADDALPKVLLLTERSVTPPLLQALSVESLSRASLAVVLSEPNHGEVSRVFGADHKPFLVHILDEATLEVERFDREFERENLSGFISRAVARLNAVAAVSVRELTARRYEAGTCGPTDPHFCLLLLGCPRGQGTRVRAALRAISHRLKSEPVKIFFTRGHSARRSFGLAGGSVLLLRGKRQRFKVFAGDTTDPEALLEFVQTTLSEGAPLPSRVLAAINLQVPWTDVVQSCSEDPVALQDAASDMSRIGAAPSTNSSHDSTPFEETQSSDDGLFDPYFEAPHHDASGTVGSADASAVNSEGLAREEPMVVNSFASEGKRSDDGFFEPILETPSHETFATGGSADASPVIGEGLLREEPIIVRSVDSEGRRSDGLLEQRLEAPSHEALGRNVKIDASPVANSVDSDVQSADGGLLSQHLEAPSPEASSMHCDADACLVEGEGLAREEPTIAKPVDSEVESYDDGLLNRSLEAPSHEASGIPTIAKPVDGEVQRSDDGLLNQSLEAPSHEVSGTPTTIAKPVDGEVQRSDDGLLNQSLEALSHESRSESDADASLSEGEGLAEGGQSSGRTPLTNVSTEAMPFEEDQASDDGLLVQNLAAPSLRSPDMHGDADPCIVKSKILAREEPMNAKSIDVEDAAAERLGGAWGDKVAVGKERSSVQWILLAIAQMALFFFGTFAIVRRTFGV